MNNDVSLIVGGNQVSGWTSVRITRGIERMVSDFDIAMTDRYPGMADDYVIQPGDYCQVMVGSDIVVTGYIDRLMVEYGPENHMLRITGRGKCCDLVDCSAEWPGSQIVVSSVLQLAQKLVQPYSQNVGGITVTLLAPTYAVIPQFNFMIGETPFEILDRVCRYMALLCYDGPDGNLILSQVSTTQAASGFTEGVNVQSAGIVLSMDQRFSRYQAFLQALDVLGDLGNGGNLLSTAFDPLVTRHRLRTIIAEAPSGGREVAIARAEWEAERRAGRGKEIRLTTDSWRDSAGVLWAPNTLVPINMPNLKVDAGLWCVSEVTYNFDDNGTTAELILMPPAAFEPEPILLQPTFADLPNPSGE